MLKSTKEFNSIIFEILKTINDGKDFSNYLNQEHHPNFEDVLIHCVDNGYINGVYPHVSAQGEVSVSIPNPRLTLSGLNFIENYHA